MEVISRIPHLEKLYQQDSGVGEVASGGQTSDHLPIPENSGWLRVFASLGQSMLNEHQIVVGKSVAQKFILLTFKYGRKKKKERNKKKKEEKIRYIPGSLYLFFHTILTTALSLILLSDHFTEKDGGSENSRHLSKVISWDFTGRCAAINSLGEPWNYKHKVKKDTQDPSRYLRN